MAKSSPNKSPAHVTGFRPIAPSIAPQQSFPSLKPNIEQEKRKWQDVDDAAFSSLTNGSDLFASLSISPIANNAFSKEGSPNQNLTNEQKQRRKEQNRAAQRAFRERKERYVKELEAKIKFLEDAHTTSLQMVQRENEELREALKKTQAELSSFKDAAESVNTALRKLRESGVDVPEISVPGVSERASKRMMRVPSSAVACIRDKDGVSFCERLKDEVCSSAYVQLLSEPLFDENGFLNAAVTEHPVPIVTGSLPESKILSSIPSQDVAMSSPLTDYSVLDSEQRETQLVPCPKVWERLSEHPNFDKFDLDQLCEELKRKAKCSYDGPVFEEKELAEVIRKMETSLER